MAEAVDRRRGVAVITAGMLALSTDSLFVRWLALEEPGLDRATVLVWIGLLSAATATTVTAVTPGDRPLAALAAGGWPLVAAGAAQAGSVAMFVVAVSSAPVADVVVVLAAAPLCTALVALVALRERPSAPVWAGIAAAAAGVLVVALGAGGGAGPARSATGVLAAVGAIVAFALGVTVLRAHPTVDRWMVVAVGGVVLALVALPAASPGSVPARAWVALVGMGAVLGPLARWLLALAPRHLPAAEVGLFVPVETLAASLWAYLAFEEVPSATTLAGGAIILAGVVGAVVLQMRGARPAGAPAGPGTAEPPETARRRVRGPAGRHRSGGRCRQSAE